MTKRNARGPHSQRTPKGRGAALRSIWPKANRDETQCHWPVPATHPSPRAGGAALRNIWPKANRDETQCPWPELATHPPPRTGGAALRNIWPKANRDETQCPWPAIPQCKQKSRGLWAYPKFTTALYRNARKIVRAKGRVFGISGLISAGILQFFRRCGDILAEFAKSF